MGFAASNDEFYSSIRLILVQVSARYQKGMAKRPAFLIYHMVASSLLLL
jgi:hypothetical protein